MPVWYEDIPTTLVCEGVTTYINFTPEQLPGDEASQEWIRRAEEHDGWPFIVKREHLVKMLEKVDPKAVSDAKIDITHLDVAEPKTGTAEEKAKAVAEKMAVVVPVAEYEKALIIAVAPKVETKPSEEPIEETKEA